MFKKKIQISGIFQQKVSCIIEANGLEYAAEEAQISKKKLTTLANEGWTTKKTLGKTNRNLVTSSNVSSAYNALSEEQIDAISERIIRQRGGSMAEHVIQFNKALKNASPEDKALAAETLRALRKDVQDGAMERIKRLNEISL